MQNIFFWLAILIESVVSLRYFHKVWLLWTGRSGYIEAYPELYRQALFPAGICATLVIGGLLARFYFKSFKVGLYIVLSPVAIFALALVGMVIASMFIRDWR